MADWNGAQPNFLQSALAGYQAGNAIGRQKRLDAALGGVDLERPETILPVLQADPATGAALLGASTKMAEYKHDLAGRAALSDYLIARDKGSVGGNASSISPSQPMTLAAPRQDAQSVVDQSGDIVVSAPRNTLEDARLALIQADPDAYIKIQTNIAAMDKAQRENLDAANDTFGAAIEAARQMPYEQRRAYIESIRPQLVAHGVPEQLIDSFDPTDQNVNAIEAQVLGVKGILERQDKEQRLRLDQERFSETQRHNRATEGTAAGALSLARQREARTAAKASGAAGDVADASTDALLQAAGLR